MSHFCVLVEADDEDHLARLLLPFKEARCGSKDPPGLEAYLVFDDCEDELRVEWQNRTVRRHRNKETGETAWPWDLRFQPPGSIGSAAHPPPAGWEEIELPLKELYAGDFVRYAEEWAGYDGLDSKTGRYGRWVNPNQKWDWYEVGGRYSARLKLVGGAEADHAPAGLVDWDRTAKAVDWGDPPPDKTPAPFFALLAKTGTWSEKGKMGWWGAVLDRDDDAFEAVYKTFLDAVHPDQRVYVVDCHI